MEIKNNYLNNAVKMYVCGPTTYSASHIGHGRTYMVVDLINRVMTNIMNIKTHLVMNITDIDDKIINKAKETNTDCRTVTKTYEKSFFDSMSKLNIKLPDVVIRVTETIPEIIVYVQKIIDNGFAYVTNDGSVYFDSAAYVKQGYPLSDLVDEDETIYQSELSPLIILQKKNKKDFALWKGRKETEVGFDAEFRFEGEVIKKFGVCGWHIECSTMIDKTIGSDLDIHFGGIDLKFPHHHNERLQAHAYYHPKFYPGKESVKGCCAHLTDKQSDQPDYPQWSTQFMHIGHLCIKGLKMSKSLKNFTTVEEILKEVSSNQMRWLFITHKWTETMDFNDDIIEQAKIFDTTLINFFNRMVNYPFDRNNVVCNQKEFEMLEYFDATKKKITTDLTMFKFDTAASLLFELINKTNTYVSINYPNECLARKILDWIVNLVNDLGFIYQKNNNDMTKDVMSVLIDTRGALRELTRDKDIPKDVKQKLFAILDKERNVSLPDIGITLQDTKESSSWFSN